jgi:RNA polymerase sigma-70 factor (ECF subfamily)
MNSQIEQFLLMRIRVFKDEQAFARLMQEHEPGLRRFLFSRLPGKEEVEDVLSSCAFRAWNYARENKVDTYGGLLFAIARGVIGEFYQTREKQKTVTLAENPEGTSFEPDDQGKQSWETVNTTEVSLLKKYLALLSEDEQVLITLRYLEGLTWREIGKRLGKSSNTIQKRGERAIKKLQSSFHKDL